MSLQDFIDDPWRNNISVYKDSIFHLSPSPEYSTAEITLSSLYRAIGYFGHSESKVVATGAEFKRQGELKRNQIVTPGKISPNTVKALLTGVLSSPKDEKQSKSRNIQLCPLIPDIALYSGSPRQKGNPWNPGELLKKLIIIGSKDKAEADEIWGQLFNAMSITSSDDIWARWLDQIFQDRRVDELPPWSKTNLEFIEGAQSSAKNLWNYPAKKFVSDLIAIIDAKDQMTRKQWISLLESCLRIGVVTHVLWLCKINDVIWKCCNSVLLGEDIPKQEIILNSAFLEPQKFFSYGKPIGSPTRDIASRYLVARLGINLVLWALSDLGLLNLNNLNKQEDVLALLGLIQRNRDVLIEKGIVEKLSELKAKEAKAISVKQGIGSKIVEFSNSNLWQLTANPLQRGYDQGFFSQKRGVYKSSPWILSLGPVAVLAMVHCCLSEVKGPRSVLRFAEHLKAYGIDLAMDEIANGDLGKKLRMLGLVLDSPDAENGMLLVPPFKYKNQT
ncbi:hypothetical protein G6682_03665 [Polynucleobacter paneuropaeus]|jgi:hypothetical protein|nr:hypothetical protein G6682_03665 [Polynucleobacter paneuropaeus]